MDSEFYNAFATSPATAMAYSLNIENGLGSSGKPPRLLNIEDYNVWKECFCNWVQATSVENWFVILEEYSHPNNEHGVKKSSINFTQEEKKFYCREIKMINYLQQSIRDDIFSLLHHTGTAYSIWQALKNKYEGGKEMMKSKKVLLKKEFDIFKCMKGENVKQMIERYSHLIIELKRFGIEKGREELVDMPVDAVPNKNDWFTFVMILKNNLEFETISLNKVIQKLEGHELELRKQKKMNNTNVQQDVNLYYRGSILSNIQSSKIGTAFSAENSSGNSSIALYRRVKHLKHH